MMTGGVVLLAAMVATYYQVWRQLWQPIFAFCHAIHKNRVLSQENHQLCHAVPLLLLSPLQVTVFAGTQTAASAPANKAPTPAHRGYTSKCVPPSTITCQYRLMDGMRLVESLFLLLTKVFWWLLTLLSVVLKLLLSCCLCMQQTANSCEVRSGNETRHN